jgi:dipeptidyl-peptidase-3
MNKTILTLSLAALLVSCGDKKESANPDQTTQTKQQSQEEFDYNVTQFADIGVLRYQIPGWEELSLQQQKLVYYLTQAGLAGRDIIWDQNYRHNLEIRKALEHVWQNWEGDKESEFWKSFEEYTQRVWFANGIHHHYSMDKMMPGFEKYAFAKAVKKPAPPYHKKPWK